MDPTITAVYIILFVGLTLIAVGNLIKVKEFYFGDTKREYYVQLWYAGIALTTIAVTILLIAFYQYDYAAEELLFNFDELGLVSGGP